MSVSEAVDTYGRLAKKVFGDQKGPTKPEYFKATNLEEAIKSIIGERIGKGSQDERMFDSQKDACKT